MATVAGALRAIQDRATPKNLQLVKAIRSGHAVAGIEALPVEVAWAEHQRLHEMFLEARTAGPVPRATDDHASYLDVKVHLAKALLDPCMLCERACGAARTAGKPGACGVRVSRVGSAFLHFGEEPPIVPSGTIFFTGCNLACVFCQNEDISTDPGAGTPVTPEGLASIATSLARDGARNINYVGGDPSPHLAAIVESMKYQDAPVAQLWNSNMYSSARAMAILLDLFDIWLPDLKYGNDACAKRLSGIDRYGEVVTRNLQLVHDTMVVPGHAAMIIRHLVLPNHVDCCTIPVLEHVAARLPRAAVNLMSQYRPHHLVTRRRDQYRELLARPTSGEMQRARDAATRLGIDWQPFS